MAKEHANAARLLAVDMIRKANSGHTGIALGAADILTELYMKHLVYNPNDPKWKGRDRFILSAGHGSALLYAVLYLSGYKDICLDDLKTFRQLGSKCSGHPENNLLEGVEASTDPLGQGIAIATGMALGQKILTARYGELLNSKVYCLVGDGDLMEGMSYEATAFAGHHKLNNLIVIHDDNKITIDGAVSIATSENQKMRFEACGFKVLECNGNDENEINAVLEIAKKADKPVFISAHTKIGYGAKNETTKEIHGAILNDEEYEYLKQSLDWNCEPFETPKDILEEWRNAWKRNKDRYYQWQVDYEKHPKKDEIDKFYKKELTLSNSAIDELMEEFKNTQKQSTRKSSGKILNKILEENANVIGGTADLGDSTVSMNKHCKVITNNDKNGNYIHYGIREHAMGAIMTGLSLTGFVPYSGTYLVFSDYYKAAIRMNAFMGTPVIHVLTHDSVFIGEDGVTHQPTEQLDTLRLTPNLYVFRPCDMEETIECYKQTLMLKKPVAMILSRQDLKQIYDKKEKITNGAYCIYATNNNENDCDITILSSGSEVSLSIETAKLLEKSGYKIRIVSIYCNELLQQLTRKEVEDILYKNSSKIIAIEASSCAVLGGLTKGGLVINIPTFGKSAKGEDLQEYYGFTPQKCKEKISNWLNEWKK